MKYTETVVQTIDKCIHSLWLPAVSAAGGPGLGDIVFKLEKMLHQSSACPMTHRSG